MSSIAKYQGESRDGVPHGWGVKTYPDGTRIEGAFRDGELHGRAVVTFPEGNTYEGEWREGVPVAGRLAPAAEAVLGG